MPARARLCRTSELIACAPSKPRMGALARKKTRRLLLGAIKEVQAGRAPRGINPTYYRLGAAEGVVPRDADWRQILTPDMATSDILQTV